MLRNYLKTAWRNLVKNRSHSIINIVGLSIGLACGLLILLWVQNELSIDDFNKNGARIYKIYEREYYKDHIDGDYDTPGLLGDELMKKIPEIEYAVMMQEDNDLSTLQAGNKILKVSGMGAGVNLFKVFSYSLLLGMPDNALASISDIAISEKTALLFFGSTQNAMGKAIRFNNKRDFIVHAVFRNIPEKASRKFDYVIGWEAWLQDNSWAKNWANSGPLTYVLLRPDANAALVDKKISHFRDVYAKDNSAAYHAELGLQEFNQVYLHSHFNEGRPSGGRIDYVNLFSLVAIFILLIACINFMNLTTARSVKRAKEVGVRKAIGALRTALIKQFIVESLLISAFAVSVAICLMIFLLPLFNNITQKQIVFPFSDFSFWLKIELITLFTGIVSGSYPALFLSSFNPLKVLKGTIKLTNGAVWFRKGLVVFQFVLSVILIMGTIVVSRQVNFIQSKNLGYDRENLIYMPVEGELSDKYEVWKQETLQMPGIENISIISDNPVNLDQWTNGVDWDGRDPGTLISFEQPATGYDFVKTMKLEMKAGRYFSRDFPSDTNAYVINETAAKRIGYMNAVGRMITKNGRKCVIVGVLRDFHFRSLHDEIKPMIIELGNGRDGNILVRTAPGKTKEALTSLEKICKQVNPRFPFTYSFLDEEYKKLYDNEQVVEKLSDAFSILAIFISCLGLLGLMIFTAEQRRKEIGIRKVLGASVIGIVRLIGSDILVLVVTAIIIACPAGWWAMNVWLNNYAYKIDIGWWMFPLTGGVALFIALFTISFQAIKAAAANPVISLRSE